MRQVGLTVILAQIGCMVPATYARLGITDKIFTRVGAVDDVSLGQSTFQVEMAETAAILSQATPQSLVLLDEIGRGTAVADGIAIAWAVAEHMAGAKLGHSEERSSVSRGISRSDVPRTLFVTHYHELNVLADLETVEAFRMQIVQSSLEQNELCCDVKSELTEANDKSCNEWVYTHRILPGPSWESHGLAIARRAGFPSSVLSRAEEVLSILRGPAGELSSHLRCSLMVSEDCGSSDSASSISAEKSVAGFSSTTQPGDAPSDYAAGLAAGRAEVRRELDAFLSERFGAFE